MANPYYDRLNQYVPGELADGQAVEAAVRLERERIHLLLIDEVAKMQIPTIVGRCHRNRQS